MLHGLSQKEVLSSETVEGIERSLSSRDCIQAATVTSSPLKGTDIVSRTGKGAFGGRPDKRQIEQRIEEDRERHKRLREGIWAVSPADGAEFARLWDETSAVGEDDLAIAEEEAVERRTALRFE